MEISNRQAVNAFSALFPGLKGFILTDIHKILWFGA
jgi:hypothetical protein